jgi:hypothetical protein
MVNDYNITMGLDGAPREDLPREAFLVLVTSARAGRFLVKRVLTALMTFLLETGLSEMDDDFFFSEDESEEGKRRLRVNILCLEVKMKKP